MIYVYHVRYFTHSTPTHLLRLIHPQLRQKKRCSRLTYTHGINSIHTPINLTPRLPKKHTNSIPRAYTNKELAHIS